MASDFQGFEGGQKREMNYCSSRWFHRNFSQNQTGRILKSSPDSPAPASVLVPKDKLSHIKAHTNSCWIKQMMPHRMNGPSSVTCAGLWGTTSGFLVPSPSLYLQLFPGHQMLSLMFRISFCLCLPANLEFPDIDLGLPSLTLHCNYSNIQLWSLLCPLHSWYPCVPFSFTDLPPNYGFWP